MRKLFVVVAVLVSFAACGGKIPIGGEATDVDSVRTQDASIEPSADGGPPVVRPPSDGGTKAPGDAGGGACAFGSGPPPGVAEGGSLRECGYLTIKTRSDVAAASDCRSATTVDISQSPSPPDGDASAYGDAAAVLPLDLGDVSFPNLTTVQNIYLYHSSGITSLSLPSLTKVSGYFYFDTEPDLTTIDAPELARIGQYFYLSSNAALSCVNVSRLTTIDQYIYVTFNSALVTMSLDALVSVGQSAAEMPIYFAGNTRWCPPTLARDAEITASFDGGVAPVPEAGAEFEAGAPPTGYYSVDNACGR